MRAISRRRALLAPTEGPNGRSDDLVVDTIRAHAPSLLATARRHSWCADDAHDAYQRALEIFIRRASSLEPEGIVGWLHTVVKHHIGTVLVPPVSIVSERTRSPRQHGAWGRPAG